jgi:hypothetical protein
MDIINHENFQKALFDAAHQAFLPGLKTPISYILFII